MKTRIILLSSLFATLQLGAQTVSLINEATTAAWVDQKVEEIKPQRKGLSASYLNTTTSPFIVIRNETNGTGTSSGTKSVKASDTNQTVPPVIKDMSKEPLTLQIILNSSALINGKWLKVNDSFRGYSISQIESNHVVLERKNKTIKLFIAQKSDNINISTK